MWKLLALGVIMLSIMGAVGGFAYHQQQLGYAKAEAKQAQDKAKLMELLADANELARQDAVAALAKATQRQVETRKQLAATELSRQAANEALARTNARFAAWTAELLPDPVPDQLQQHIAVVFGPIPSGHSVSGGLGLSPGPNQSPASPEVKR